MFILFSVDREGESELGALSTSSRVGIAANEAAGDTALKTAVLV